MRAAISEFAEQGEAGARTDAIAHAAGVNKALIHYYFGTKERLYGAALEAVFQNLAEQHLQILNGPGSEGERLLRYFIAHFDQLSESHTYTRLLGHEMMRARAGQSSRIPQIVALCFGPLHAALHALYAQGMATGELRRLEPGPVLLSLIGANVFYFISAPFYREMAGQDPRAPRQIARQRAALLDSAATLMFADPAHGRQLAGRILSQPRGERP
ncbi:MAG: TetR/AcrR family transcriptional regulator [Holophaga sp.]|nr:TetR/AcrR family transcriptional regulator [Holophaga sp.]